MNYSEITEIIEEIKSYIKMPELDFIIETTIKKVFDKGCKLLPSKYKSSRHEITNFDCIIIVNISPYRNKIDILWDLFHEFGHHLDNNRITKEDMADLGKVQYRERSAWEYADLEFIQFPELQRFKEEYISFKRLSLLSYEIYDDVGII